METVFLKNKTILFVLLLFSMNLFSANKLKVGSITIVGNNQISKKTIEELIHTKSGRTFNIKDVHLDKTVIKNYYFKNGFLDVWVEFQIKKTDEKVDVTFAINEGKRFYYNGYQLLDSINITGMNIHKIFKDLKAGTYFNQALVELKLQLLENLFYDNGYPFVRVNHEYETINDTLIVVQINVMQGPRVKIVGYNLLGNVRVDSSVILREVELKTGDYYSRSKIQISQKNIYSTGLFETVNLNVVPKNGDSTNVILQIRVSEKPARYIGFKFGFSYEENVSYGTTADFQGEFGHLNLFGTGRSLRFVATPSITYDSRLNRLKNIQNKFILSYGEPWFLFPRALGRVDLSYFQRKPPNFINYDIWTSSLGIYEVKNFSKQNVYLSYQFITNIRNVPEDTTVTENGEEQDLLENITAGNEKVLSLRYEKTLDKRDNIIVPTKGYLTTFKVGFSYSQKMQADVENPTSQYIKLDFLWNRYQDFPLKKEWTLATRIRLGYIKLLGKGSFIPVTDRYVLGGASSIRGFYEGLVGPVGTLDGTRVGLGGRMSLLTNVELRIPIWKFFLATSFLDAGNVWNQFADINADDIRIGTGGGIALSLQFIVVRLEYGLNPFPKADEANGIFHFGIAFAF